VNEYLEDRKEQGFTLIELLIAIVVVGILAAVAIVGIAGLTTTSGKSACTATKDSATAAAAAFYANNNNSSVWTVTTNGGPWPKTFTDMTTVSASAPVNTPAVLEANGSTVAATTITGSNWTLTIGGGGNSPTTFTGC
jgi:type IV pilus assembly protein PilA